MYSLDLGWHFGWVDFGLAGEEGTIYLGSCNGIGKNEILSCIRFPFDCLLNVAC